MIADTIRDRLRDTLIVRTSRRPAFCLGMEFLSVPHLLCAIQENTPDLGDVSVLLPIAHADNETTSTAQLLEHPRIVAAIRDAGVQKIAVLPYVCSTGLEEVCEQQGHVLFAPPAALVRELEEKESAHAFLSETCPDAVIPSVIRRFGDHRWEQGSAGYAVQRIGSVYSGGKGTMLVRSEDAWHALAIEPDTMVKIATFIDGPSLNVNACAVERGIIVTDASLQVIGPETCAVNAAAYCGNDWETARELPRSIHAEIEKLTTQVGGALHARGYRGWFGIDFLLDRKSNRVHVTEVNPRLQGSTSLLMTTQGLQGMTTLMTYHLAAHLHLDADINPQTVSDEYRATASGGHLLLRNGAIAQTFGTVCPTGIYRERDKRWERQNEDLRFSAARDATGVSVHGVPPVRRPTASHDRIATIQSPKRILSGADSARLDPGIESLARTLRPLFSRL